MGFVFDICSSDALAGSVFIRDKGGEKIYKIPVYASVYVVLHGIGGEYPGLCTPFTLCGGKVGVDFSDFFERLTRARVRSGAVWKR